MADLKTEADSLSKAAARMLHAADPSVHPLSEFKAASHDLSAFGALGSLLKATGEIRDEMHQLSDVVRALQDEWHAEGKAIGDVGKVLDEVDRLLEEALPRQRA